MNGHDDFDDDDDDDEEAGEALWEGDSPELEALGRFAGLIERLPWFAMVGQPLSARDVEVARDYLDALGFPDTETVPLEDWLEAADAALNPDIDTSWWETEEQLRAGLTMDAVDALGEEALELALTHIARRVAATVKPQIELAAALTGGDDPELLQAALGAAAQACHQAALVLAAGAEPDHPFAHKLRLYEQGRWPVSVVGGTFSLF
jgi:hypothetical protein